MLGELALWLDRVEHHILESQKLSAEDRVAESEVQKYKVSVNENEHKLLSISVDLEMFVSEHGSVCFLH